jgi:hypothetical protein
MVAGFIALLKVALIMALLGQTPTVAFGGVTRFTVGAVCGAAGLPAFGLLLGLQHPAAKPSNMSSAANKILWLLCVHIVCLFFSAITAVYRSRCATLATLDQVVCSK